MRTNLVADASSSAEPLVQHMNADGETVATAGGQEGDGGGPDGGDCAAANVGTCDPKYWSCPGAAGYKVRGQTYLKVRPSCSSLCPCAAGPTSKSEPYRILQIYMGFELWAYLGSAEARQQTGLCFHSHTM